MSCSPDVESFSREREPSFGCWAPVVGDGLTAIEVATLPGGVGVQAMVTCPQCHFRFPVDCDADEEESTDEEPAPVRNGLRWPDRCMPEYSYVDGKFYVDGVEIHPK